MMKKLTLGILGSVSLFVASAFALPPYATLHTYYDANGQEIGWRFIGCTGGSSSGQITGAASVTIERIAEC